MRLLALSEKWKIGAEEPLLQAAQQGSTITPQMATYSAIRSLVIASSRSPPSRSNASRRLMPFS